MNLTKRTVKRALVALVIASVTSGGLAMPARAAADPTLTYRGHIQDYGWKQPGTKDGWVGAGASAGTTGKSKRVEALQVKVSGPVTGGVECSAHVQNVGWTSWVSAGKTCGTTGRGLRVEAVKIRLTGNLAKQYDVYYQSHVQNVGWMGWAKNGAESGTAGGSLRVEALRATLVPKGKAAPGSTSGSFISGGISYAAHVQNIGDQKAVSNGSTAGTSGRSLRVESLILSLPNSPGSGVQCRAHVQNIGWTGWVNGGQRCGTAGRSLRVEAIQIRLTGQAAKGYDVQYQTHVQDVGWTGWSTNGASSGSTGMGRRMEAVRVKLVGKGKPAPGYNMTAPAGAGFNLDPGRNGYKVFRVRQALGLSTHHKASTVDATMVNKVKAFQRSKGLPQTGVVDLTTWVAMGFGAAQWTAWDSYMTPVQVAPGASSAQRIEAMVNTVMSYRGKPYVWGGSNAEGADCSGAILQGMYAAGLDPDPIDTVWHAASNNNLSSKAFYHHGGLMKVPYSQARRGDLLFYSSRGTDPNHIHHVSLYLGNGQAVDMSSLGFQQYGNVGVRFGDPVLPTVVRPFP